MSLLSLINIGNFILIIAIIAMAFFTNIFAKLFIILISAFIVRFNPGFDITNILFILTLILGNIMQNKLPFTKNINIIISIFFSLTIFNIFLWLT